METQTNHAINNARGHLESIRELLERWKANEDGNLGDDIDQEFYDYPLSVMVRGPWHVPGTQEDRELAPCLFEILLTTGGPALRIIGPLDQYAQPERATMQWQDWGTPWTDLHGADMPDSLKPAQWDEVLLAFASHFYYGE